MIAFVGGFSNSDVLGSAKGWAGSFLFNEKAKKALDNFFARKETLSLGVCNGCQLLVELALSIRSISFTRRCRGMIPINMNALSSTSACRKNHSVMLHSLGGGKTGSVDCTRGRDSTSRFLKKLPYPGKFSYHGYPANPNGSQY